MLIPYNFQIIKVGPKKPVYKIYKLLVEGGRKSGGAFQIFKHFLVPFGEAQGRLIFAIEKMNKINHQFIQNELSIYIYTYL